VKEIASAFQESVVDILSQKVRDAANAYSVKGIILGGGVAANLPLRQRVTDIATVPVCIPEPKLCTDNGAMIAACAYFQQKREEPWSLTTDIFPGLKIHK
jgi:N6-L-threonylcarbamoyladenine synthase